MLNVCLTFKFLSLKFPDLLYLLHVSLKDPLPELLNSENFFKNLLRALNDFANVEKQGKDGELAKSFETTYDLKVMRFGFILIFLNCTI